MGRRAGWVSTAYVSNKRPVHATHFKASFWIDSTGVGLFEPGLDILDGASNGIERAERGLDDIERSLAVEADSSGDAEEKRRRLSYEHLSRAFEAGVQSEASGLGGYVASDHDRRSPP